MRLTVYTLATCEQCRAAKRWLRGRDIAFKVCSIRRAPPSRPELRAVLRAVGDRIHLLNTEHPDYFRRGIGHKLDRLSENGVVELLLTDPDLIRRPLVIGHQVVLAGFDPAVWAPAFANRGV